MDTGFPTVVWGARLVFGLVLPWILLALVLWVSYVFGFEFLPAFLLLWLGLAVCAGGCVFRLLCAFSGWGLVRVCLDAGCWVGGGYEGRGVAPFPPFSAGGCSVCPGVGWDVACPFLVGFAGSACG